MASVQAVKIISLPQGESLSGKLNYAVTMNAAGRVVMTDSATDVIIGTVASDPGVATIGAVVSIALVNGSGTIKVVAQSAITRGHLLHATSTNGRLNGVSAISGLANNQQAMGIALEAASAAEEVIEAICHPIGPKT